MTSALVDMDRSLQLNREKHMQQVASPCPSDRSRHPGTNCFLEQLENSRDNSWGVKVKRSTNDIRTKSWGRDHKTKTIITSNQRPTCHCRSLRWISAQRVASLRVQESIACNDLGYARMCANLRYSPKHDHPYNCPSPPERHAPLSTSCSTPGSTRSHRMASLDLRCQQNRTYGECTCRCRRAKHGDLGRQTLRLRS